MADGVAQARRSWIAGTLLSLVLLVPTVSSRAQTAVLGPGDRPIVHLPVEKNATASAVDGFYFLLLMMHDEDRSLYDAFLEDLGIEPGSEAARIVTESALDWRAWSEENPAPTGLRGAAFEAAGWQWRTAKFRRLHKMYHGMLRELAKTGFPTEKIELEIEERRRRMSTTLYGGYERDPELQRLYDWFDATPGGERP